MIRAQGKRHSRQFVLVFFWLKMGESHGLFNFNWCFCSKGNERCLIHMYTFQTPLPSCRPVSQTSGFSCHPCPRSNLCLVGCLSIPRQLTAWVLLKREVSLKESYKETVWTDNGHFWSLQFKNWTCFTKVEIFFLVLTPRWHLRIYLKSPKSQGNSSKILDKSLASQSSTCSICLTGT